MNKANKQQEQTNHKQELFPLAHLLQLGREKSFITYDDILRYFPNPENDIEALDRVYAALLAADIPYIDD